MLPSIFGENLFDDWFESPIEKTIFGERNPLYGKHAKNLMKTDVRETDSSYELAIDLPGFKKEDIKAQLKDGYLTISASTSANNDEQDKDGRYIRQERYTGQCCRTFYVGDGISQEEIRAKFEDGILKLSVPKKQPKAIESSQYISIEG